jgi:hypothetical protein
MEYSAIIVTIMSSLISGFLGVLISTYVYVRRDVKMFKMQTLKKFASNRYDIKGDKFTEALNEIIVVFNDSPKVMDELDKFHKEVTSRSGTDIANDRLVRLYKTMCKVVGVNYSGFNDSFFLTPFNIKRNINI